MKVHAVALVLLLLLLLWTIYSLIAVVFNRDEALIDLRDLTGLSAGCLYGNALGGLTEEDRRPTVRQTKPNKPSFRCTSFYL